MGTSSVFPSIYSVDPAGVPFFILIEELLMAKSGCAQGVFSTSMVPNHAFPQAPDDLDFALWPDDLSSHEDMSDKWEAHQENSGWRYILCARSHPSFTDENPPRVNAGIGVGFIGSVSYVPGRGPNQVVDERSTVATLRMICAPWSSVPFTDNWPFLRTAGTSFANSPNNTQYFSGQYGSLADTLVRMAEVRIDEIESDSAYLRPISMKTCPPNYFLKGVKFTTGLDPDTNERIVRGFNELICERSIAAEEGAGLTPFRIDRPLYLEDEDQNCTFTMSGRCFSRSQYIGWPRTTGLPNCDESGPLNECEERTLCPPQKVATGFSYQRNTAGHLSGFNLQCIQAPQ